MYDIRITPHGFGTLTREDLITLSSLLIKAGYTDVGIDRSLPKKGKAYVYSVRAKYSHADERKDSRATHSSKEDSQNAEA